MSTPRDQAVHLLQHYFQVVARKAGLTWDPDFNVEIGEIIDLTIAAAREPHLSAHAQAVEPHLTPVNVKPTGWSESREKAQ